MAISQATLDARHAYHRALAATPQAHFHAMQQWQHAQGLGKISTLPQPYLLPASARAQIQDLTHHLATAMEIMCRAFVDEGLGQDFIELPAQTHDLIQQDAASPLPFMHCARFDLFYEEETGRLSLLECNAGDPSGDGYADAFLAQLLSLPAQQALQRRYRCTWDRLLRSHYQLTLRTAQAHFQDPQAQTWVKLSDPAAFVHDDHQMIQRVYEACGQPLQLADPRHFAYDGQRLTLAGEPVDIVLRDTIDELILAPHWPATRPILDAYAAGHILLLNEWKTVLADFKGLMELLSDPQHAHRLPPETQAAMVASVPWTRVVRERRTSHQGQDIDLLPHLRTRRPDFVLKPNEGYGGFGIFIGAETTQARWEEALDAAIEAPGSYIVQAYIPTPTTPMSILDGEAVVQRGKKVTISAWVHDRCFAGSYARISDASIINVHQGGGLLPIVYIDDALEINSRNIAVDDGDIEAP